MKRVKTVEQLAKLALQKKAVFVPNGNYTNRHMPAAFMIGMSANYLLHVISYGLFVYEAKNER